MPITPAAAATAVQYSAASGGVVGFGNAGAPPAPTPQLLLTAGQASVTVGVQATGWSVSNTGTVSAAWAVAATPGEVAFASSSGTLAAGANVNIGPLALLAGLKSIVLTSATAGAIISGSPAPFTGVAAPPPPPPPPAPQGGQPQVALQSATGGTKQVTFGFCCRQGQFTGGIVASGGTTQVTVRNRWPDNSAKFVEVAGSYISTGGVATTITLASGTASSGTALTTTDLQAALTQPVTVDAGGFGSASWSGSDWASPFLAWTTGHLMSSWVYRRQVGADAHLVAWLEVRLYLGGSVEVLPWIENGYINVASPTSKSATYGFTMGGTSRFSRAIDLPARSRTPLIFGSALSHWLGTDPDVTPTHDKAYLQATELVPSYGTIVEPTATAVTGLVSSFTPLQQGDWTYSADTMSSGGFAAPIGLLPNHEAVFLTTTATAAYGAVIRNGYSAGRYPIHYRDEATNRPLRFSTYPNLSTNFSSTGAYPAVATGTAAPQWDIAHHPSVGFLPYLLTGRFYFMEQTQFVATTNYISNVDVWRNYGDGWHEPYIGGGPPQVREAAWAFRSLVQALTATPDADTNLRNEFIACVEANINRYHARYVAASNNPLGFIQCDVDYALESGRGDNLFTFAPWQQDFHTASWGMALAMNLPISGAATTKLSAFFAWKAQSVVGRLGTSSSPDYWWINAAAYEVAIAPTDSPNWSTGAGPWYTTWRQVYDATQTYMAAGGGTPFGSTEGIMSGEILPGANAVWGNLQPAISYAVRHGVAGAQAAYDRMTQATNWPELASAFKDLPVWSVKPAVGLPTWLAGAVVHQVVAVPGGQTPGGLGTLAFCGMANRDALLVMAATGGHGDSSDNGVRSLDLTLDSPTWVQRKAPFGAPVADVAYYRTSPTIEPTSRHSYNAHRWSPVLRKMVLHGTSAAFGSAITFGASNLLDLDTWEWSAPASVADGPGHVEDTQGRVYGQSGFFGVTEFLPVANTRTFLRNFGGEITLPMAFDSKRGTFFQLSWGNGGGGGTGLRAYRYGSRFGSGTQTAISFNASTGLTALLADQRQNCTLMYVPVLDRFYFWTGYQGGLFLITPNSTTTWDVEQVTLTGVSVPARPLDSSGDSSARAVYVPRLGGIAILHRDAAGVQFIKVH